MAKLSAIIAAAGKSSRFQDKHYKKVFASLDGRAVWLHSAERFLNRSDCGQLILVIAAEDREAFQMKFGANVAILGVDVVEGGAERADSIERALARVKNDTDLVAVHDAARPCLTDAWISAVVDEASRSGAAVLGVPVSSTLKEVKSGRQVARTVSRENLWEAQTPQVFRRELIMQAYAQRGDFAATDDAQLVERTGQAVSIVPGSPLNLKITTRDDLRLAEQVLKVLPKPRPGGVAHPFADDRWR